MIKAFLVFVCLIACASSQLFMAPNVYQSQLPTQSDSRFGDLLKKNLGKILDLLNVKNDQILDRCEWKICSGPLITTTTPKPLLRKISKTKWRFLHPKSNRY